MTKSNILQKYHFIAIFPANSEIWVGRESRGTAWLTSLFSSKSILKELCNWKLLVPYSFTWRWKGNVSGRNEVIKNYFIINPIIDPKIPKFSTIKIPVLYELFKNIRKFTKFTIVFWKFIEKITFSILRSHFPANELLLF